MAGWSKTEVFSGDGTLVRIRSAHARELGRRCPERVAVEVRPGLTRVDLDGQRGKSKSHEPTAPSALNAVLDLVEFDGLTFTVAIGRWSGRTEPHPALVKWVTHAADNFRKVDAEIAQDVPGLVPVSRWWARQRPTESQGLYEETVHGRRYEAEGVREIRLLRIRSVTERRTDDREVAFAAGVLAGASPVLGSPWSRTSYQLGRFEAPSRVRVIEIGCVDGSVRVLFDGTRLQAVQLYEKVIAPALSAVSAGGDYVPGDDCGGCALVDMCPAVPAVPGLLKISDASRKRRTWSMTTARAYKLCPARAYLGRLFLPADRDAEDSDATRRGRAVHDWIEQRHRRLPHRRCRASDVPESAESWESGGNVVEGEQARLGIQMIGDHSLTCPMRNLPAEAGMYPERPIVVFDPDADVVVVVKADLLYRGDRGWVLRETKTERTLRQGALFDAYPQLAVAVVLSSAGVLADGGVRLRVELERLTRTGPVLTELDVGNPVVAEGARESLSGYVDTWWADSEFKTKPGKACLDCPYTRWCPDARENKS